MTISGFLKEQFLEPDANQVPQKNVKAHPGPQGQPSYTPSPGQPYLGPATTSPVQGNYSLPPTMDAEAQRQFDALSQAVYSIPSSYVTFRDVRATMGNPADVTQVFKLLEVANKTVTRDKVITDIDMHLGIVKQKRTEFEQVVQNERASKIDQPQREISELQASIQQMESEIATRRARVNQLQADVTAKQQRITDGQARFKMIEEQLEAPLLQTRQLLTNH